MRWTEWIANRDENSGFVSPNIRRVATVGKHDYNGFQLSALDYRARGDTHLILERYPVWPLCGLEKRQSGRPKRVRISRRPARVMAKALLSSSWITHFRFNATLSSAAPTAPPMCGRRSLQSKQAYAKRRLSERVSSTAIPSSSNAFVPLRVSE